MISDSPLMQSHRDSLFIAAVAVIFLAHLSQQRTFAADPPTKDLIRFATYNVSMYRQGPGELAQDLQGGKNEAARMVAEIIQRVRPDVLLLNEFDYDSNLKAAQHFCNEYLQIGQNGHPPILYPYLYAAPVNTGVPSGLDLNNDSRTDGPDDAYGFGRYPGQYGMLLLSQYPIQSEYVRTFQKFLWKDMPQAALPPDVKGKPYYSPETLDIVRLSSKSHWDVPVVVGNRIIHVLAAHPTPPIYDGPEKRNARRNHDEIRFWADYVLPGRNGYIYDDNAIPGGLTAGTHFVILGDYNADPFDGDTHAGAIKQLLAHPLVNAEIVPESDGGVQSSRDLPGVNLDHRGPPAHDTANFSDGNGPGNLRVDYVLPSATLEASRAGVFWPATGRDGTTLVDVSDHRLVWLDVKMSP